MFWVPLLAGVLVACSGPVHQVLGALDDDVQELRNYDRIIERILESHGKLLREEQKRKNQQQAEIFADRDADTGFEEEPFKAPNKEIFLDVNENREQEDQEDDTKTTTTTEAVVHQPPQDPQALQQTHKNNNPEAERGFFIWVIAIGCGVAGLVGLIMAGVCWYKLHTRVKAASDVDYPAYGVTGPTKERLPSPGDRKLAQSAQMYHYQHQKQQMIAMEKANGEMKQDASEEESEEENEEGDYTVYECPGLAPTGEMEVRNPLFTEEGQTPVNGQAPTVNGLGEDGTTE